MNHRISFLVEPDKEPEVLNILYKWHIEFDAASCIENGVDLVRISTVVEDDLYVLRAVCSLLDALNVEDEPSCINLRLEQIPEMR